MSAALLLLLAACDSGGGSLASSGTVVIEAGQGVSFATGQLRSPGNFKNSDLFASANGTALKLATGGPSPTTNNPVTWFRTAGGVHETFANLDEVPTTLPTADDTEALVRAAAGNGFVAQAHDGGYVRGWISTADRTSVTLQWRRVVLTTE